MAQIETFDEWIARNSEQGKSIQHPKTRHHLYPTGAYMDYAVGQYYPIEAPEDPELRIRRQIEYRDLWIETITDDANRLRDAFAGASMGWNWPTNLYGPPPQDLDAYGDSCPVAALLRLKRFANVHREERRKLKRELNKLPSVKAAKRRAKAKRESIETENQRNQEVLMKLDSITV